MKLTQASTRYSPLRDSGINRFFDELLPYIEDRVTTGYDWSPAADIKEEDDRYVIHVDLPGVEAKAIDIALEDGVLAISGERNTVSEESKDGYRRIERVRGKFYRRFSLPDTANQDGVSARCEAGVLEVAIEKQARALPRKIKVDH